MKRKITQKLIDWKQDKHRKPLVVRGARQVGKTYSIREFANNHFEHVAYFNLDSDLYARDAFGHNLNPQDIIKALEAIGGVRIDPVKTVLVLDEIQSSPRAVSALKYFYEQAPEYHVIAAGSLLGVAINREEYSFPVGKVNIIDMYPLDFEEYLWAVSADILSAEIRHHFGSLEAISQPLHDQALSLYRDYLVVGGMPEAVSRYVEESSILAAAEVHSEILEGYVSDMAKYATPSEAVRIRQCYQSIPAQLAKENRKFQYKVVQKGGSAAYFGSALEWLVQAGVAHKCQKTEAGNIPFSVGYDLSSFKLYSSDTGLLCTQAGVNRSEVLSPLDLDSTFIGALAENYVATALVANGHELVYWGSGNSAEVDFMLVVNGGAVGLEVKAGKRVASKSLSVYINSHKAASAYRLSTKNFGSTNAITSIPLYAAFCL